MEDVLITEYTGTIRDEISRFYQYGSGGIRVLDAKKSLKRIYLFDPASDIMTERDPRRQDKILRRFVFDRFGMLEETFAFGQRPRTFRYEDGGRQIAVREDGMGTWKGRFSLPGWGHRSSVNPKPSSSS